MPALDFWENCDECKKECVGDTIEKVVDGKKVVELVCDECRDKMLADGWKLFDWQIKKERRGDMTRKCEGCDKAVENICVVRKNVAGKIKILYVCEKCRDELKAEGAVEVEEDLSTVGAYGAPFPRLK